MFTKSKFRNLFILTKYELRSGYAGSAIGTYWNFLRPVLQFILYWFIFGIVFKRNDVRDVEYFYWFLAGFVPWFFISQALSTSAGSIIGKKFLIKSMKFPTELIPIAKVLKEGVVHIILLLIFIPVFMYKGYFVFSNIPILLYASFSLFVLLLPLGKLFSLFTVMLKDFVHFLIIIIQAMFWFSPIVWDVAQMSDTYIQILRLNPFFYIFIMYKYGLTGVYIYEFSILYTCLFWGMIVFLYIFSYRLFKRISPLFEEII